MKRTAEAYWTGDTQNGEGKISSMSGALKELPYSFKTRFLSEDGKAGTNPEELIAAAHAACFTMATSHTLNQAGFTAESLHTEATVEIHPGANGFSIDTITLHLQAKVPNLSAEQFQTFAEAAKASCPVSKALAAVPIHLEVEFLS